MSNVFTDGFVEVVNTRTKRKSVKPRHYLGHPVLGKDLELAPSAKVREELADSAGPAFPEGDPAESWTRQQLDAYAALNDVDVEGATTKADVLAAIEEAATRPDGRPDGDSDPVDA